MLKSRGLPRNKEKLKMAVTPSPRWCPPQGNMSKETKGKWWQLPPCLVPPCLSGCSSSISECDWHTPATSTWSRATELRRGSSPFLSSEDSKAAGWGDLYSVPSHFGQALVVGCGDCREEACYAPLGSMPWLQIGTQRIWPETVHDYEMHPLKKNKPARSNSLRKETEETQKGSLCFEKSYMAREGQERGLVGQL